MKLLSFLRYIFRRFPGLLLVNTLMMVLANLFDAFATFAVAPVVDYLINQDLHSASRLTQKVVGYMAAAGLSPSLRNLLGLFILLFALMNVFQILARYYVLKTKYAVLRELYVATFEDFFRASWYFFTSGSQGTLLNTFLNETTVVGNAFSALAQFLASLMQLGLFLAVPFYLSWQITLISMATAGLFALPFILIGKKSYQLGQLNTATGNQITAMIHENLSLAKIVIGFGNQERSAAALARAFDSHVRITIKAQALGNSISNLYHPLGILVLAATLFSSRRLGVSLSETAVLLLSLVKIIPAIGQLATQKNGLDNFFPSFEQVNSLRQRAQRLRQQTGQRQFTELRKELALEGLSFAYPGHDPVLADINLRIPKGKMIALVGESGAGKSTLIDMIMGFHEPMKGRILVDGFPLGEFDINSYRRRIGYVPQDSALFNASIRANLLWAKENASEEELRRACRLAHADEFIDVIPQGYETQIGDRGVRLSGGQIQRIALARAILRKPEILILDEATSSLDSHSERLIQQAIEDISKETTIIVIAHRLSTIVNADYIYVLKRSRVIEEGPYLELIRKEGPLLRMVQLQLLEGRHETRNG